MLSRFSWAPRSFALRFFCATAFALMLPAAAAQDIFVTPIPNAPFSAVINVERSFVQRDGSVTNVKTQRQIARDSRGRIYNEARTLVPNSSNQPSQVQRIHLYDPQTRVSTILNPEQQTFWTRTLNRPPETMPPGLTDATPIANVVQQNEFLKKEDLGIQQIGGIAAHGVRETQTIPAESGGTQKEVTVTDEYWYSDDLRMNLLIKHSDPRKGSVTLSVGQVQRTEPDAAIFDIPAGYKRAGTQ